MKHYTYQTQGTCSTLIDFDVLEDKIFNVEFTNGCDGNLKAIGKLVDGQSLAVVQHTLSGIHCGSKSTSCGDQLSNACANILLQQQIKTTLV